MDTDQLADADFARACELSSDLRELVEKESCTQGKLMDALLLKRNDVHHMPHTVHRRHGGGEYFLYPTESTVRALLPQHGGAEGLAQRLKKKQERAARRSVSMEAKLQAEKAKLQAQAELQAPVRNKLIRALRALGLELRADSARCQAYIDSPGATDLKDVLRTMAHMHWLHNHTNGAYRSALNREVETLSAIVGFFYPGIRGEAASIVNELPRFALPVNGLPWLPQFITTREAIDAAVAAAADAAAADAYDAELAAADAAAADAVDAELAAADAAAPPAAAVVEKPATPPKAALAPVASSKKEKKRVVPPPPAEEVKENAAAANPPKKKARQKAKAEAAPERVSRRRSRGGGAYESERWMCGHPGCVAAQVVHIGGDKCKNVICQQGS